MRIFVTGGTGFVGKPVVRELLGRGHEVLLLTRNPGAHKSDFRPGRGRLIFLKGNLSGLKKWEGKLRQFKPDAAIHMAWEGIPDYGPVMSAKNLRYGLNLITALASADCKTIVATGSCWEYGSVSGKVREDQAVNPANAFSEAKVAFQRLGEALARANGMSFVWTRLFFVYGPGQKETSLIPYLIQCAKEEKVPTLNNPKGGNDFVYVDDVASALRLIVEKHEPSHRSVYNIGTGRLTAVSKIVRLVCGPLLSQERSRPRGFYADVSRIKKEIGWVPAIDIREGVKKTISHYERAK